MAVTLPGEISFDDRDDIYTGIQPVGVSVVELIRGKVREDGARRMKLWTFGEAQADLGEISDNRTFFNPAVTEYSAGIAGHVVLFSNCLLDGEIHCILLNCII